MLELDQPFAIPAAPFVTNRKVFDFQKRIIKRTHPALTRVFFLFFFLKTFFKENLNVVS